MNQSAVRERSQRWLGELPDGWSGARLFQVANAWPSSVDKHSTAGELPVRLCNYVDVYRNDVITPDVEFMTATATAEQVRRFLLLAGDTLVTKDSETADDIGVPSFVEYEAPDLLCGYHLAILRPKIDRIEPKFLFWAMKSGPTMGQWRVKASGVTRVGLRTADLTKVTIPVPPLEEQRRIADYLDAETAQIDALIAEQEHFITLLSERRDAVRDELGKLVGAGSRLKWSVREIDHRLGASDPTLPLMSVSIDWGVRRRDEFTSAPTPAESLHNYKVIRRGQIVVNRMRAFQGALGATPQDGIVSPDYAVLSAEPGVEPRWLSDVMRSSAFVSEMVARLRGIGGISSGAVRTPRINVADIMEIELEIPRVTEQHRYLRSAEIHHGQIDVLADEAKRNIALSKERRAALITAAVTGQIDVTTGRAA